MKRTLEVQNVKCGGCASTLTKALEADYGDVEVNLEKTPREITLDISDDKMDNLKLKLRTLGYPLVDDELSTFQTINTKAKSFVSCAIGKMN
ncbi:MAG: heavy-metal-associated domain-containing protein [Campylobacterota bacterium]|nr:heavy-metal-associated domain-containing protein [Campylobacterota bacterium]